MRCSHCQQTIPPGTEFHTCQSGDSPLRLNYCKACRRSLTDTEVLVKLALHQVRHLQPTLH